jgi:prophage antirepressor-like protein
MNNDSSFLENNSVRKIWHRNEWWFVIEDVILTLIYSPNAKGYINEIKLRDKELNKWYEEFVYSLEVDTENDKKKMDCTNLEGVFRIIQSIISPKAEPFKRWMAKLGRIRIEDVSKPD